MTILVVFLRFSKMLFKNGLCSRLVFVGLFTQLVVDILSRVVGDMESLVLKMIFESKYNY